MAKLSEEEAAALKKLQEKQKAPDTPAPSMTYNLNLDSDTAWERAKQLGLVSDPEPNGGEGEEGGEGGEGDTAPKRRGYFGDEG